MEYEKGYVYELMDQGGPTDNREPYFKEAVDEMMRSRVLCAKANAALPDDPAYVGYLEELFGRKLEDVRILTPFICDFGNRVSFGKGVFINHSAILSASGGNEFEDVCMAAPGLRFATINHDVNDRHTVYTYGKVTVKKNAWLGMNVTICPGVTVGEYAVVAAGAPFVPKDSDLKIPKNVLSKFFYLHFLVVFFLASLLLLEPIPPFCAFKPKCGVLILYNTSHMSHFDFIFKRF